MINAQYKILNASGGLSGGMIIDPTAKAKAKNDVIESLFQQFGDRLVLVAIDGAAIYPDAAIDYMLSLVAAGIEYPDAEYKTLSAYSCATQQQLTEAYDAVTA